MPWIEVGELRRVSIAFLRRQAYFAWAFAAAVLFVGVGSFGGVPALSGSSNVSNAALVGVGIFLATFGLALFVYPSQRMPVTRLEIQPRSLRFVMANGVRDEVAFAPPQPGSPWMSAVAGLVDRSGVKRERPESWFTLWYADDRGRQRAVPLGKGDYDAILAAWRAGGGRMREDSVDYPRGGGTALGYQAVR